MAVLYIPWGADPLPLGEIGPDTLVLPASVPAAMALQEQGVRVLRSSDLLASEDFHDLWRLVISAVWRAIEASATSPTEDEPQLLPIFGYSLAIALAQFLALGRLLDRVHERHGLTEIRVERPLASPEDVDVFGSGI